MRLHLPIVTERCILRSLRVDDHADVLSYRSRVEVGRHLPGGALDAVQVGDFIAASVTAGLLDERRPALTLGVEWDGHIVGDLLLRVDGVDGPDGRQFEVGWAFNPAVGGRGLATEAARALVDAAFGQLSAHRVWARLDPANLPSVGVCDRLGMRREALFERASWWHGDWDDLAIHAIRADEWPVSG